jgi:2-(1,2-epoxy-1,2-dihydrophenyl)acetyl-CoA isomerase
VDRTVMLDHNTTPAVSLDVREGVAHVTLRRGARGNAIGLELARSLQDAALVCGSDPRVRAILLSAEGRSFCVGGDLREFSAVPGHRLSGHLLDVTGALHAALRVFAAGDAPVVAAVHGAAAGAGVSLAAAADVTLAATDATFLLAYTNIGYSPDGGATWTLPRLIGHKRALELLLLNPLLSAAEAQQLGLVTTVVPPDRLMADANAAAHRLASGPTRAFGATRRLVAAGANSDLDAQLDREAHALASAATSPEGVEGVAAFLEKRPPRFSR